MSENNMTSTEFNSLQIQINDINYEQKKRLYSDNLARVKFEDKINKIVTLEIKRAFFKISLVSGTVAILTFCILQSFAG